MKMNNNSTNTQQNCQKPYMVVPSYQGLSESVKENLQQAWGTSLLQWRCHHQEPSDGLQEPGSYLKRSGVIYRYKCDRVACDDEYIGESSRTFGERFKEHQKVPSPTCDHYNISGHLVSIDNFSIVGTEDQNLMRTIKEALNIRLNNPSLNRNIGKYHLPHIWDEVLHNTSELKLT